MNRWLVTTSGVLLCCLSAFSQASPDPQVEKQQAPATPATLPTVEQVLSDYVRALGGEQALRKLNSRVMKGTFEIPARQISGVAELDMQSPDRFYSRVSIPDGGDHILVFDGRSGWAYDPQSGLREVTGLELTELRRSSQFLYESRLRALFSDVRVLEKTMEEDRPAWLLQAIPAEGPAEQFFFDAETGLLLRHDSTQSMPDGDVPVEHRYSNYISVDGVKVPTLLRHRDSFLEWQVKFSEIRHNVPIDPARFSKPQS